MITLSTFRAMKLVMVPAVWPPPKKSNGFRSLKVNPSVVGVSLFRKSQINRQADCAIAADTSAAASNPLKPSAKATVAYTKVYVPSSMIDVVLNDNSRCRRPWGAMDAARTTKMPAEYSSSGVSLGIFIRALNKGAHAKTASEITSPIAVQIQKAPDFCLRDNDSACTIAPPTPKFAKTSPNPMTIRTADINPNASASKSRLNPSRTKT